MTELTNRQKEVLHIMDDTYKSYFDIAEQCDMPKPTIVNCVMVLLGEGFIKRGPEVGGYFTFYKNKDKNPETRKPVKINYDRWMNHPLVKRKAIA